MNRRVFALGATGLGALLLLISVVALDWRTIEGEGSYSDRTAGFGLRSLELCDGNDCRTEDYDWDEMKDHEKDKWVYISTLVTFLFGLATTGLLCVAAGVAAARPRSPARKTWAYLAFALTFCTCLGGALTGLYMGMVIEGSSAGAGYVVFIVATISGAVGSFLLARPAPDELARAPSAVPPPTHAGSPVPACPGCGAPMQWVGQHSRWFCAACQVYR